MFHKKDTNIGCWSLFSGDGMASVKRCGVKLIPKFCIALATLLTTVTSTMIVTSCGDGVHTSTPKTSETVISDYRAFWQDLKSKKELPGEDLSNEIKMWQKLKDSVIVQLARDSIRPPHTNYEVQFEMLHDSIRYEFTRIVMSRKNTYKDFVLAKEAASPYINDGDIKKAIHVAEPFFLKLNQRTIKHGASKTIIADYTAFLNQRLRSGIASKEQMLEFIKEEDYHFRRFLSCFDQLHDQPVGDINQLTEKICKQTYTAANDGKLSLEDALVYMTIRNNRRLIQNAQTCLSDIKSGKVQDKAQAQSYSWVLLQPYTTINEISVAMLTTDDRHALLQLAEETPKALGILNKQLAIDSSRLDRMPTLLIKAFIYTV